MNEPVLTCENEQRLHEVRKRNLNGLDYLEVSDDQRSLCVHFIGSVPENITKDNIWIEGGQRIRDIKVTGVEREIQEDPTLDSCLQVFVNKPGDFSTYTLRLVRLEGFDPRYAQLKFSFKVGCPSDLDCKTVPTYTSSIERIEPEINYLAKDYASFRQLILDRLALIMPDWQERHVPDLGITLVELLAYVGDYLSYYQDAVATEAYLDTARQRISVRRHVRLVDYAMHEGCNARTWVWLETENNTEINLNNVFFITKYQNTSAVSTILSVNDLRNISSSSYEVFEPIFTNSQAQIHLYKAHNEIRFYTWGDRQCCLPKGATSATLLDGWVPTSSQPTKQEESCDDGDTSKPLPQLDRKLKLKAGDILIFEEVKGAKTDNVADANITHRHAIRLTRVEQGVDAVYPVKVDNVTQEMPTPIVEISWALEDALPFPLCISAIGLAPECKLIKDISVARGNVILIDHGQTLPPPLEDLKTVVEKEAIALCEEEGQPANMMALPELFRPQLKHTPLTFRQPLSAQELSQAPASKLLTQNPRLAVPQITKLIGVPVNYKEPINPECLFEAKEWEWTLAPRGDLQASYSQEQHFVVEMDDEGYAHLRFGNGELGRMPEVGTRFFATYRIGNSIAGNIGADTIAHAVFRCEPKSIIPHNPLPAQGGIAPEPLSEVKLFAPHTFAKELQRAITAQDYADIVMRDFSDSVQRSAAMLRWTGSWCEVLVVIDPLGTQTTSEELLTAITKHLYRFRRIGHDIVVKSATYVPLDIAMTVCVQPNYLRGHIKAALLDVFSNRILADARRGFFHPDNLTFGTGIALSKLVASAQAVPGVENVVVTKLQRLYEGNNGELDNGILPLNLQEVAQLDNNPNFPENGKFELILRGGR
ncbi:hypothetical protein WA1_47500 [Scytonema hofmannii PCC 7110]|uniref:Baseplate assembly protein n=1 Tax=Scytonema hofmannii PCC 7110 TaxID=128403 RepID=A0A139WXU7_9CYAN|nr:putative baseplate assembly protein [Scytonema hofmannii]KYC37269.1 hypothetical protein WA1_47500 [Scytonema hofmannii PCC 7110]